MELNNKTINIENKIYNKQSILMSNKPNKISINSNNRNIEFGDVNGSHNNLDFSQTVNANQTESVY
jgi:hypothetical protein